MIVQRCNPHQLRNAIKAIGADAMGVKIMSQKGIIFVFQIQGLGFEAMNILKQEALSAGGDLATPREAIKHQGEKIALLIATQTQLKKIIYKLGYQPFGLKELQLILQVHLDSSSVFSSPQLMAIINVTPDSFYASSRQDTTSAIDRIYALLEKKVEMIDIGAASSRPGSELLDAHIEIERLKGVVDQIYRHSLTKHCQFSIDTYNPQTADFALSHGFSIVNDVSGFAHSQMPKITAKHNATAILMHTKGTPKEMQNLTHTYTHLINDIDAFFACQIQLLRDEGVKNIVLDVGFGFAKNVAQNLEIIKNLAHFKHFGFPILVGASRKSTIGEITNRITEQRLSGTLALHLLALQNGANILRVHDEDEHIDMIKVYKALQ